MFRKRVYGSIVLILIIVSGLVINFNAGHDTVEEVQVAQELIAPPLPNPYIERLLAEYEAEVTDMLADTQTPALAIAIVKDNTILFMKAYGVRDATKQDSVDVHTVFRLASVSKCFAPLLTGVLVKDSVLEWNDRVVQHLPDFELKSREDTDSLRLAHVLSHTTGLPYHTYTTLVEDGLELPAMLEQLRNVSTIARPGELYSYQNVAYSIIAEVIRARTGKTYEALMHEKIFSPLGMADASMNYESITQNNNVAQPHLHWRNGWKPTTISNTYYNVGPAGGVNASISDMAEWLKAMLGGQEQIVSKETLDKIFTPMIKARTRNRYFRKWVGRSDSHYALGWRVLNFKTDTLLYHGGYVTGYRSEVAIDRHSGVAICALSNGPGKLIDNVVPLFFNRFYHKRDSILYWQREQRSARLNSAHDLNSAK